RRNQSEQEKTAWRDLAVEREIFAAHDRVLNVLHAIFTESVSRYGIEDLNSSGVIACHRIALAILHLCFTAITLSHAGSDFMKATMREFECLRRERTHRAADLGVCGNDVVR